MNNCIDLSGKVAVVTGASSGIGYATALELAKSGASVVINYQNNESGAEDARKQIIAGNGRAICVQVDVTKSTDVAALVQRSVEEFGPPDILVNNAGS